MSSYKSKLDAVKAPFAEGEKVVILETGAHGIVLHRFVDVYKIEARAIDWEGFDCLEYVDVHESGLELAEW